MRISIRKPQFSNQLARRGLALLAIAALTVTNFATGVLATVEAQQRQKAPASRMTEDQNILHVLNRLGFGARPGDVERVRAMGIQKYIEQQMNPATIPDTVADNRVKDLSVLSMTTAQLYEKYPQPGQILRQLQRRGDLPASAGNKGTADGAASPHDSTSSSVMTPDAAAKKDPAKPNLAPGKNEDSRRAIREYYTQNGLLPPQRIVAELQASRIIRATYSERQLQEVLVDFWTNHFNVFAGKGADRWLLVSYDRDTIRPNTLGKFKDLLIATAQSPAMLFYLDNFQSVSPNSAVAKGSDNQQRRAQGNGLLGGLRGRRRENRPMDRDPNLRQQQGATPAQQPQPNAARQRRGINENYARELMELHTLGVDGGYTQKDVQEVARCFTGWTIFAPRGGGAAQAMDGRRAEMLRENAGKFFFNQRAHDDGEKIVLGQKIPGGSGFKDGLMVLDILSRQPATAKFIATKLTRYFVNDNPSPALVDHVSAAFTRSDGDIRETLKAIFFSSEFNSPEAYRAKVKRPFELAISALRTLGAETSGGPQLHQWIARMGEPLYGYQTPNGYSDTAESWVNTGGLLERLNFGLALASNRIPGTRVDLNRLVAGEGSTPDKAKVMDLFLRLIVAGNVSAKTRETLLKQLDQDLVITAPTQPARLAEASDDGSRRGEMSGEPPANFNGRQRVRQLAPADATITDPVTKIVGLILGSPEFQRQ